MGAPKKTTNKTRREFFSIFKKNEEEMVKMLTPEGKLVSIPKSAIIASDNRKKVKNQDILDWMNNPSIKK